MLVAVKGLDWSLGRVRQPRAALKGEVIEKGSPIVGWEVDVDVDGHGSEQHTSVDIPFDLLWIDYPKALD